MSVCKEATLLFIISYEIFAEITNVLNRDYIRASNPQITDKSVEIFLTSVLNKAVFSKNISPNFTYSRDPKVEKYINLAIEAEADYLVSRDKDMLDLMNDISVIGKEFR